MSPSLIRHLAPYAIGLAAIAQPATDRAAETERPAVSIAAHVTAASGRFGIPEAWIYAVMRVESAGEPHAVSPKGASGLMQLMPATWAYLRARYALGDNIYDTRENILAGAAYMRELYDRYGAPGFLAAYNAGPLRYEAYLRTGRPLPAETILYLAKLSPVTGSVSVPSAIGERPDPLAWTRAGVFVGGSSDAGLVPTSRAERADVTPESLATEQRQSARSGIFAALSGRQPR